MWWALTVNEQGRGRDMINRVLRAVCAVVLSVCLVPAAHAADITLAWDANTETDLEGYRAKAAAGACATVTDPARFATVATFGPMATTGTITIGTDGIYCFALTAFDTAQNESPLSNRVERTINENPPGAPAGLRVLSVTR